LLNISIKQLFIDDIYDLNKSVPDKITNVNNYLVNFVLNLV